MNYLTRPHCVPYVGGTLSPRSFLTAFPFCSSFFHKIEIIVFAGSYLPSTFMTIKKLEASRDILHMLPFHQGRRPSPSGNSSFSFQFTDFFQARSPPVPRASRLPQKSRQQIRSNMAKYPGWNLGNDQSKSPHPKPVITILYLNNPNHRTFLIGFGLVCFLSAFLFRITALLFFQPLGESTQGTLIELLNPTEAEFPMVTCQKGEVHTPPPNKWEQKICVDHICHSFPPDRESGSSSFRTLPEKPHKRWRSRLTESLKTSNGPCSPSVTATAHSCQKLYWGTHNATRSWHFRQHSIFYNDYITIPAKYVNFFTSYRSIYLLFFNCLYNMYFVGK